MAHSNSSLNLFTACQRKYWHQHINHTTPCKPPSPHLTFGAIAHEVLEKAGNLRDNAEYISADEYVQCIPSELLYEDLKKHFNIKSWHSYFAPIISQIEKYEKKLADEILATDGGYTIKREIKLSMNDSQLRDCGLLEDGKELKMPLVGVIDLLLLGTTHATIIDYKFSTSQKTQDNFDMDSQLYIYALFVSYTFDIPLHNIKIGYIDIPKEEFAQPIVLTNGTLSRAKSQNVSAEMYLEAIKRQHPDTWQDMIQPGGYYYDILLELTFKKCAYLNSQYLDLQAYAAIIADVIDTAVMIDLINTNKYPYLARYDAYTCKSCEYIKACKHWLGVNDNA